MLGFGIAAGMGTGVTARVKAGQTLQTLNNLDIDLAPLEKSIT